MPIPRRRTARLGLGLTAAVFGLGLAVAPAARADDPPTRVGRIVSIDGTVSFHPSATDPWGAAIVNYPLAQSTALFTDAGGRAEVEIGEARVRLDSGTELDIVQLDDQTIQLAVPQGRIDVSLHGRQPDEHYSVQTPRGDVELFDNATYRVVAGSPQDPTRIASFGGRAQLTGPSTLTIGNGEEAVATPSNPPAYQVGPAGQDAFDQWSAERDRAIFARPLPAYVPPVPGVESLDQYGSWRDDPQYGHVWIPTDVAADWEPYRVGHWAWVDPWGWTWVDNAPWGFAPFHYGRWAQFNGAWGWIPVEPGVDIRVGFRPVYAPALVSFIGDPGSLVVGVGIGAAIGWVVLGPNEPWHPYFHASPAYIRNVNVFNLDRHEIDRINVVDAHRTFANQRFATIVPQRAFAGAERVDRAVLHVQPQAFNRPLAEASPARGLPRPTDEARAVGGSHERNAPPAPALHMDRPAPASAAAFQGHPGAGAPHENAAPQQNQRPVQENHPAQENRPAAIENHPAAERAEPQRPAEHSPQAIEHPAAPAEPHPAERPQAPQQHAAPAPQAVERPAAPHPAERPAAEHPPERPQQQHQQERPAERPAEHAPAAQAPHPAEHPQAPREEHHEPDKKDPGQ